MASISTSSDIARQAHTQVVLFFSHTYVFMIYVVSALRRALLCYLLALHCTDLRK